MTTVTIRTDSTPNGVHSWYSWLGCHRKAWLGEIDRAHRVPTDVLSGKDYFDIGSIGHGLLALHYSIPYEKALRLDTTRLTYKLDHGARLDVETHAADIEEATRLYRAYRLHYPKNDLGKVVDIEKEFELEMGAMSLSGGLDLVVRMTSKDLTRNGLDGLPGIYIVDHKFYSKKDPMAYELALHDPQFITYPYLYEAARRVEVQGTIVNIIYKTVNPGFERFVIPKMAINAEWPIVSGALGLAARNKAAALKIVEDGGLPEVNTRECYKRSSFGTDVCKYHKNGSCDRRMR